MKYIVAILRPHRLDGILEKIQEFGLVHFTLSNVMGHGLQKATEEVYRNVLDSKDMHEYVKLELAVNDVSLEPLVEILKTGFEGELDDGKIFVLELVSAISVRTGERDALVLG